MAHAGGGIDSEQGTHKCEMNSGEGNGKPLLDSNSCLEDPLLDLQESEQTRRTTTMRMRHVFVCGCPGGAVFFSIVS